MPKRRNYVNLWILICSFLDLIKRKRGKDYVIFIFSYPLSLVRIKGGETMAFLPLFEPSILIEVSRIFYNVEAYYRSPISYKIQNYLIFNYRVRCRSNNELNHNSILEYNLSLNLLSLSCLHEIHITQSSFELIAQTLRILWWTCSHPTLYPIIPRLFEQIGF